jgi:hypothetical protein
MTCPHCQATARSYTEVDGPGHAPRNGCRGICARCLMWWAFVENDQGGQLVKYTPTIDEQVLVGLEMIRRKRAAAMSARNN